MKIAIAHDYLVTKGGAERVVAALHRIFPEAPIFTSVYSPEHTHADFHDARIYTSSLQKLLKDPSDFRRLAPLMPRAFRKMRIEGFDVVLSSTSGFAHGVRPKSGCHIAYTYAPPRFLWDDRYERGNAIPKALKPFSNLAIKAMRRADRKAAKRPHATIAISKVTAERIRAIYGIETKIIHPPVDIEKFRIAPNTKDEFLLVSRLLAYKNVEIAIRAFNQMQRKLVIVGEGPEEAALRAISGPTIEFRGPVNDEELVRLYGRSRATIMAAEEDFGLTPLEANASGRPIVAYKAGGAIETVIDGETGLLYAPQNPIALIDAVEKVTLQSFDPSALRAHAETFSEAAFAERITSFVDHAVRSCIVCHRSRRSRKVHHMPKPVVVRQETKAAAVKTP
ncbi:MAG: glycosyltransferase [Actinomycetota bacterium]